jgi:leucyl/phenylalanyl-tRNA---protein transferase
MIPPNILLAAYMTGYFPMADADNIISWYSPDPRAIIPLDRSIIPRSTRQLSRKNIFRIETDTCFEEVIRGCGGRNETWINQEIIESYLELHRLGYAHSIESFDSEGLAGGLYGVALGSAFFGESMFSLRTGASKVALAFLIEHLARREFTLLDTQYVTPHLKMFGAVEIPRKKYLVHLRNAMDTAAQFLPGRSSG